MSTQYDITIKSPISGGGYDEITFVPADYTINYDSLAAANSGRTANGLMRLDWKLRKLVKLTVKLPPHKPNDVHYSTILSLVQGQIISVTYYDYLKHNTTTEDMYCSKTSAGYTYMGMVEDVGFELIAMNGTTTVPHIDLTEYTATWVNYDSTVLATSQVLKGTTPTYPGTTPTRPATAQYTYTFSGWSPTPTGITANTTYTAQYSTTTNQYTITATAGSHGSVSGGGTYNYGTSVTLTATSDTGYSFSQWNDGSTTNPRTITVTGDATYSASFSINSYTITTATSPISSGTITGGGTYTYGSTATLTVTPNTGLNFVEWSDGNTDNPRTVTVTGDATYTATINEPDYLWIMAPTTNLVKFNFERANTYNPGTLPVYYSFNKSTWHQVSSNTDYSFNGYSTVYFKGENFKSYNSSLGYTRIHLHNLSANSTISIGGDITTLINPAGNVFTLTDTSVFNSLFRNINDSNIDSVDASALKLTSTTLTNFCYDNMFYGSKLTAAPTLPVATLAEYCYRNMFYGCDLLESVQTLPATYISKGAYDSMYRDSDLITISDTPTSTCKTAFRLPMVGTATAGINATANMFGATNPYGTPAINTTYFISSSTPSYYTVYWDNSMSFSDESWDVLGSTLNVSFYSNGTAFSSIYITPDGGIFYDNTEVYDYENGWINQEYRTLYNTTDFTESFQSDWTDFYLANDQIYNL